MVGLLFIWALIRVAGKCSRAEEEAERRRWERMQKKGGFSDGNK